AIVLVSHDRHLIGLVSDTFWRVSHGVVKPFDGDLDEYAAWLRSRPAGAGESASGVSTGESAQRPDASGKTGAPAKATTSQKSPKVNPHKLEQAESQLAALEFELAEVEKALGDPETYGNDGGRVQALGQRQQILRQQLAQAEETLLQLYAADAA
ncbi:MAG: hypothetical protein ACR2J7_04705, partial [Luteimonas sp.]